MWELRRLTTLWVSTACCRESFTFTLISYGNFNSEKNKLNCKAILNATKTLLLCFLEMNLWGSAFRTFGEFKQLRAVLDISHCFLHSHNGNAEDSTCNICFQRNCNTSSLLISSVYIFGTTVISCFPAKYTEWKHHKMMFILLSVYLISGVHEYIKTCLQNFVFISIDLTTSLNWRYIIYEVRKRLQSITSVGLYHHFVYLRQKLQEFWKTCTG
jgi:hypothetical protein